MSELVKHQQQGTLTERMNYAKALATADLLPPAYRNKPGNVLLAVEYGQALGVPPMTAIQGVHVIQGKPTLSADLMAALIRRAGHKLRVRVDPGPVAVAQIIRTDDPDYTYECRWDMERAKIAKLTGKDNWVTNPKSMLKARAISEVAREACSEVLHGLIYTPDELGATVDGDGHVIDVDLDTGEIHSQTGGGADNPDTEQAGVGSPPAAGETQEPPAPPPHPTDVYHDGVSPAQLKKIGALMTGRGMTDRGDALAYVANVIGRHINSRNELTKAEASAVVDALEQDTVQEAEPHPDEAAVGEPTQQELA
jgi:hypothetical protein